MSAFYFAGLKSPSSLNIEVSTGASLCLNKFLTVIAALVNCIAITLEYLREVSMISSSFTRTLF